MRSLLLSIALFACVVLPTDSSGREKPVKGQKKADKVQKKEGKADGRVRGDSAILVAELRKAHHILHHAEPIFHGHRATAMKQIKLAIDHLKNEVRGTSATAAAARKAPPKKYSLDQVKAAKVEVGNVLGQLGRLTSTIHRAHAIQHLGKAMRELELALAEAHKPKAGKK